MAGFISYKDEDIDFNNRQFNNAITFVSEVARKLANDEELKYVDKMDENVRSYYPGMCFDIEDDFPDLDEKKFWAIMFYETAREIFERKIGVNDYFFWQTERIYQIYGSGNLFFKAVREVEPRWSPETRDYREHDEWLTKQSGK